MIDSKQQLQTPEKQEPSTEKYIPVRQVKGRKTGLFVVDNIFVDKIARYCKPSCISVYMSLCRHADNKKQTCFPSEKLIAEENGISVSNVKIAIKKLEKLNLIYVFRSRRAGGTRNVNIYTLFDVTKWEHPQNGNKTIDIKQGSPEVIKSKNHGQKLTNKDTHNIKDTNNKEDFSLIEEETEFVKLLKDYKPPWLK